jgi:hypothetical protein
MRAMTGGEKAARNMRSRRPRSVPGAKNINAIFMVVLIEHSTRLSGAAEERACRIAGVSHLPVS